MMINRKVDRRIFLSTLTRGAAAAALPGSLIGSTFLGCTSGVKELERVVITGIDRILIEGKRPRVVGRNSRLGVHGQMVREPVVRLHTDAGITGWGWSRAEPEQARMLLSKKLSEVFDPDQGTGNDFLPWTGPEQIGPQDDRR
jgi:hypothetical protein